MKEQPKVKKEIKIQKESNKVDNENSPLNDTGGQNGIGFEIIGGDTNN